MTHRLASGNLEDFGGETDGAFDAELLVLCAVDQVAADYQDRKFSLHQRDYNTERTFFQVANITAGEGDPDLVDLGWGNGCACSVVFFFTLRDITHVWRQR